MEGFNSRVWGDFFQHFRFMPLDKRNIYLYTLYKEWNNGLYGGRHWTDWSCKSDDWEILRHCKQLVMSCWSRIWRNKYKLARSPPPQLAHWTSHDHAAYIQHAETMYFTLHRKTHKDTPEQSPAEASCRSSPRGGVHKCACLATLKLMVHD